MTAVPKPPRTPKKAKKPLRAVNPARKRREFVRCFHSKERVEFVKVLGCVYCAVLSPLFAIWTVGKCHNAHTENGGRGRKGNYDTIIPLCPNHHRMYDDREKLFANPSIRDGLKRAAPEVERLWQSHLESLKPGRKRIA